MNLELETPKLHIKSCGIILLFSNAQLQSGAIFSFPAAIAQGLAGAEPDALAQVEVTPMGDGLHWPTLDADFSVTGLLAGMFGTPQWMADLQQRQAS